MTSELLTDRELTLLEEIELDPDVTQASLASQLGVAVGTVNWHLKRLVAKGYVKVKRAQRRKLRYIITPEGLAFRAMLTVNYIETSMRLYRRTRQYVRELLAQVRQAGYDQVYIEGDGDIADICRLTCLEMGIRVGDHNAVAPIDRVPALEVIGTRVYLRLEEGLEREHSG
jgi:DNA-binding MarR family transcriptional regulator